MLLGASRTQSILLQSIPHPEHPAPEHPAAEYPNPEHPAPRASCSRASCCRASHPGTSQWSTAWWGGTEPGARHMGAVVGDQAGGGFVGPSPLQPGHGDRSVATSDGYHQQLEGWGTGLSRGGPLVCWVFLLYMSIAIAPRVPPSRAGTGSSFTQPGQGCVITIWVSDLCRGGVRGFLVAAALPAAGACCFEILLRH